MKRALIVLVLVAAGLAGVVHPADAAGTTVTASGHGWGHGRGMGQYGALGYAINTTDHPARWTSAQILDHFYSNTTAGTLPGGTSLGVRLLSRDGASTTVAVDSGQLATYQSGGSPRLAPNKAVRITKNTAGTGFTVADGPGCAGPFTNRAGTVSGTELRVSPATTTYQTMTFGQSGDIPLVGDWNGDGIATVGVRRGNQFLLRNSLTTGPADATITYGQSSDVPLVGDWNGDGKDEVGVRRLSTFYLRRSDGSTIPKFAYGKSSDLPFAGDWNGDGIDTVGVHRSSTFYLRPSNSAGPPSVTFAYGQPSDQVVVGDWDGNGKTSPGVRRGTTFLLRNTNNAGSANISYDFGQSGETALAGDWDGDGDETAGTHSGSVFSRTNEHASGVVKLVNANNLPIDQTLKLCTGGTDAVWYRGELRADISYDNGQRTVNYVGFDAYVKGVVPRESPASWGDLDGGAGMAALESQAVAARSYSRAENRLYCRDVPVNGGCQQHYATTCDTTSCQVYGGRQKRVSGTITVLEDSRSNTAVSNTALGVRMLNGAAARTEFSSSTGGYTAGGLFPSVVDQGDSVSSNPNHNWTTSLSRSAIESFYGKPQGSLSAVVVTSPDPPDGNYRVTNVKLTFGANGSVNVSGTTFQSTWGLKSTWFNLALS